jgi:heptosyltransferase-2
LGVPLKDTAARVYPSEEDRRFARDFLQGSVKPLVALHPGSGSKQKNWPIENWIELGDKLLKDGSFTGTILVVAGEADESESAALASAWNDARVRFATSMSLPQLAALLEHSIFVGHDSGISHLAAAAGAECVLLFGPTDPAIWAPRGQHVRVLRAPGSNLTMLEVETVRQALPL